MNRSGVVVLSLDSSVTAFVDDILAEMEAVDRRSVAVDDARTCLAIVGGARRRRLLVINGEPLGLTASALIDAVRTIDPGLPIVLVRRDWNRSPVHQNGVYVRPGPFVTRGMHALLIELLEASRP
jgi:hypothetical protein